RHSNEPGSTHERPGARSVECVDSAADVPERSTLSAHPIRHCGLRQADVTRCRVLCHEAIQQGVVTGVLRTAAVAVDAVQYLRNGGRVRVSLFDTWMRGEVLMG